MTIGYLRKCSLTYLLLPNLLFGAAWFKQPYSTIMVLGFLYLLIIHFTRSDEHDRFSVREVIYLALFALVWTFFCGVDGLTTQKLDWVAHNSKYYDLYKNPWPNFFLEVDRFSCYYFGYYLVPAFLSKKIGYLMPSLLVAWTAMGFFFGLSWIFILIGKNKSLLLLVPFVRGVGQMLATLLSKVNLYSEQIPLLNPSMRSVFQQSLYVPNQVIPAMIGAGALLYYTFERKKIGVSFVFLVASFIWAIFPSIILVLIFGAVFVNEYFVKERFSSLIDDRPFVNYLIPGLLFLPIFGYFLSSDQISDQGFLWSYRPYGGVLYGYMSGILIDILIFYIVIRFLVIPGNIYPSWFITTLFALIFCLSIYYMGMFNDFFFRGSLPLQIIIVTIILRGFNDVLKNRDWPTPKIFYAASFVFVLLIVVGISSEVHLLRDNLIVARFFPAKATFKRYPYDTCTNTYQTIKLMWGERGANEYLGAKNSFFEQQLARKPTQ